MGNKTTVRWIIVILSLALAGLFFGGCATMWEKPKPVLVATNRGTGIYEDKYEFKPPIGWNLLRNLEPGEGDFEFGFLKIEYKNGDYPSQTSMIYDAEPYGNSRELDMRAKQYFTRFLWLSGIFPEVKKREELQLWGEPAIEVHLEGENPNGVEKVKSEVYLIKKGKRIISFVCTQWRPMNGTFDSGPFEQFETFIKSFKFLQPTFYEEIEGKIKKLKSDD